MKFSQKIPALLLTLLLIMGIALVGCDTSEETTDPTSQPTATNPPTSTPPPETTGSGPAPSATNPPPTTTTAGDLAQSVIEASAGITSYEFEATAVTTTTASGFSFTANSVTEGRFDLENEAAHIDTTVTAQGTETRVENYLVDGWTYIKYDTAFAPPGFTSGQWYKIAMTPTEWEANWDSNSQEEQNELLFGDAELTILGSETINGTDCYKIDLIPDKAAFLAYLEAQGTTDSADDIDNVEQALQNIEFTGWVAKDTSWLVRTEMTMQMTIEGASMDLEVVSSLTSINQAGGITLPAEAQDAADLSPS